MKTVWLLPFVLVGINILILLKTPFMKLSIGIKVAIGIVAAFVITGLIANWKGVIPVGLWALAAWTYYRAYTASKSGSVVGGSYSDPIIRDGGGNMPIYKTAQFKFFVGLVVAAIVVSWLMLAGH